MRADEKLFRDVNKKIKEMNEERLLGDTLAMKNLESRITGCSDVLRSACYGNVSKAVIKEILLEITVLCQAGLVANWKEYQDY